MSLRTDLKDLKWHVDHNDKWQRRYINSLEQQIAALTELLGIDLRHVAATKPSWAAEFQPSTADHEDTT